MLLDSDYNALNTIAVSRSRQHSVKSPTTMPTQSRTKSFEKAAGEIMTVDHALASPLPEDEQLMDNDDDFEPEIDYEVFEQKQWKTNRTRNSIFKKKTKNFVCTIYFCKKN